MAAGSLSAMCEGGLLAEERLGGTRTEPLQECQVRLGLSEPRFGVYFEQLIVPSVGPGQTTEIDPVFGAGDTRAAWSVRRHRRECGRSSIGGRERSLRNLAT